MKKVFRNILLGLAILFLFFIGHLFIGKTEPAKEISWGINFSQKHAELLGLDWKKTYLALLDDLKVKNIKLISHWDLIEPEKDQYHFEDLDWQVNEAEKKGADLLLVIGMKTGRWPECHLPDWAKNLSKEDQQREILELLKIIVLRYKERPSIEFWQVENEPLFPFGQCPWRDKKFLKKEIDLVKSVDPKRKIIISDSGEFSFWIKAAELGDIVGTTLHRKAYFKELKIYFSYPFQPIYYWRKAQLIKKIFRKDVIGVELQAEPWCKTLLYNCSLKEQEKTMNFDQFQRNVEFAKKIGFDKFYFWGAEWWYWLKEKQNNPEIWQEAKKLF